MTKTKGNSSQESFVYDSKFANTLENALKSVSELQKVVYMKFEKYNPENPYQHRIEILLGLLVNRNLLDKDGSNKKKPYKSNCIYPIEELVLAHDLVIWLQRRDSHYVSEKCMEPFL